MKKIAESKTWNLFLGIFSLIFMIITIIVRIVYSITSFQITLLIVLFGTHTVTFFTKYRKIAKSITTDKE